MEVNGNERDDKQAKKKAEEKRIEKDVLTSIPYIKRKTRVVTLKAGK